MGQDIIVLILFVSILGLMLHLILRDLFLQTHSEDSWGKSSLDAARDADGVYVYRIPMEDRVDLVVDDTDNVHNTTLKRAAINLLIRLKESDTHQQTHQSTYEELLTTIRQLPHLSIKTRCYATYVLKRIYQIHAVYTEIGFHEVEVLRLVWDRVLQPINHKHQEQLKNNLIEQLADCLGHNSSLVCLEGRIMRYLQTLERCDQEGIADLRPMWAYREEICQKLLRYRDKLTVLVPVPKTEEETRRFNRCLQHNLERRFRKDYIETGLLTQSELDDLTKDYYESLKDL